MHLPHVRGPSRKEPAPFEMAPAYAEAPFPNSPGQLPELYFGCSSAPKAASKKHAVSCTFSCDALFGAGATVKSEV